MTNEQTAQLQSPRPHGRLVQLIPMTEWVLPLAIIDGGDAAAPPWPGLGQPHSGLNR